MKNYLDIHKNANFIWIILETPISKKMSKLAKKKRKENIEKISKNVDKIKECISVCICIGKCFNYGPFFFLNPNHF